MLREIQRSCFGKGVVSMQRDCCVPCWPLCCQSEQQPVLTWGSHRAGYCSAAHEQEVEQMSFGQQQASEPERSQGTELIRHQVLCCPYKYLREVLHINADARSLITL